MEILRANRGGAQQQDLHAYRSETLLYAGKLTTNVDLVCVVLPVKSHHSYTSHIIPHIPLQDFLSGCGMAHHRKSLPRDTSQDKHHARDTIASVQWRVSYSEPELNDNDIQALEDILATILVERLHRTPPRLRDE